MNKNRCQGTRRSWRAGVLKDRKCGRVARWTFQTYVGVTRSHLVCDDADCMSSITKGYGANNLRAL